MIATTPFHERLAPLNETGLWSHWSGRLAAVKYQMAEKFEYFAIRNAVAVIDTSPLFKYRITGRDAEQFLAGILARDVRQCADGQAQYTLWCDDRGFVIEDGVVFRFSSEHFLLTAAEPNLAYFADRIGRLQVEMTDVSDEVASLAVQGPRSRTVLASLDFLGFGLPPGSPSLGELLSQGKNNLQAPWLAFTGFVVLGGVLTLLIFVGEAVRDAFDPRKLPGGAS